MPAVAEALNAGCICRTIDPELLRRRLESDTSLPGLMETLRSTRPHLFSSTSVYLAQSTARLMRETAAVIERITRMAPYEVLALARAPAIAGPAFGPLGALMSYDFHLGPEGPRLIEVNTNAGGALLSAVLTGAQQACCEPVERSIAACDGPPTLDVRILEMIRREWRLQRGAAALGRLLVVDDEPEAQYLAPEFELFRRLFQRHGIDAHVADAGSLEWRDGRLWHECTVVDMVYNRITDFYLEEPRHRALHDAYEASAVVLTPHPRAHALHADKRNLVVLSDGALLASWGVSPADRHLLQAVVPHTTLVTGENAPELWAQRRSLFFKPCGGYGAKAVYRGDKLTRRVWTTILDGDYVAQSLVPPSERCVDAGGARSHLKFDVRAYTYDGDVLLLAARMYSGQTTNFRTPGGGFAPVVVIP